MLCITHIICIIACMVCDSMGKRKLKFDVRKNYERKKQKVIPTPSLNPLTDSDHERYNLYSLQIREELPQGWNATCVASTSSEDSLALYKLELQSSIASVNIAYMVTVSPDLTWTVCVGNGITDTVRVRVVSYSVSVGNKIINISQNGLLNSCCRTIRNADELTQLLMAIDGSKQCIGNPDAKFHDIVTAHKGIFKNQQGQYIC